MLPDGDRDAMPVATKEALAMELPVIASDEVGLPEEVGPDRGVLVPPGDEEALAEALAGLRSRPAEEKRSLGRAARAYAEAELDLRVQAERLVALFSR